MIKKLLIFCLLVLISKLGFSQKNECDSILILKESRISNIQNDSFGLILIYRRNGISIKVPISELLRHSFELKLSQKEIKRRIKFYKKLHLENDIAEFNFCDNARYFSFVMLSKNACCIIIDKKIVREYEVLCYKSFDCLNYERYVFKTDYYTFMEISYTF
jgi:hypothetical protein